MKITMLNGPAFADHMLTMERDRITLDHLLNVDAGLEKNVTITYILPFKIQADSFGKVQSHSLLLQKQAGSLPVSFTGNLSLGKFSAQWTSPGVEKSQGILNFSSSRNVDDFWGFVISK